MSDQKDLYVERKFTECFPNLNQLSHDKFSQSVTSRPDDIPRLERLFTYLGRLIDLHEHPNTLVLGCGLYPQPARILINKDFKVVCVEPVRSFVETAREYLGNSARVLEGTAESIPLPDGSQDVVVFESVLEHVDSIPRSLEEIYQVMAPGGVLYLSTTNRYQFYIK